MGYLIAALEAQGAEINEDLIVSHKDEENLDVKECPWQILKESVQQLAKKTRIAEAKEQRELYGELEEVDTQCLQEALKKRSQSEMNVIRHAAALGIWTQEKLKEVGLAEEDKCPLCGEKDDNALHRIWKCQTVNHKREPSFLCNINADDLPKHLAVGLPGAMCADIHTTFWGKRKEETLTEGEEQILKFGLPKNRYQHAKKDSFNQEIIQLIAEKGIQKGNLNARQIFTKIRGSRVREKLTLPRRCDDEAPDDVNVFSDGSFQFGRRPIYGLGAAGVWWPGRKAVNDVLSVGEEELGVCTQEEDGLSICTCLPGFGSSSTRAEIGAGIVALCSNKAVHIATDSQAFLDKGLYLRNLVKEGKEPRKPFGSQKDGDLWRIWFLFLKEKGHRAVKITKVKGHATQDDIDSGKVRSTDKEGNDKADAAAKKGIKQHGEAVIKTANWLSTRHKYYAWLVRDIHTHIIEGYVIRNKLLQEANAKTQEQEHTSSKSKSVTKYQSNESQSKIGPGVRWEKLKAHATIKLSFKEKAFQQSNAVKHIGNFLSKFDWREAQSEEHGFTWLEMYILYKKFGNPCPLQVKGCKAKAKPSLGRQIQSFKRGVRCFAKNALAEEAQKKFFSCGKAKGYALRRLGVTSHSAHINGIPSLNKEIWQQIDLEILRLNGNKQQVLGTKVAEGTEIQLAKLNLTKKNCWSARVKLLAKDLLGGFPEEKKLEVEEVSNANGKNKGDKRKVASLGGVGLGAPLHDFVQPLLAKHARKAKTPEMPILRIGMLRGRLRERFGHLCTDG